MAKDIIDNGSFDMTTVEKLVEVAHIAGALPTLLQALPEALNYGLSNFYKNWDIMIEDIYALNPDVTLMVVGMSDNSLKGKHFDYNGVEGEVIVTEEQNALVAGAISYIIDFIMTVGNTPMIEGAKKYGYTYVDTDGTTYVDSHPDADGHAFIANKIIEALPDREIATKYEDVKPGHKYFTAIEYVLRKGIMTETSETTFSPDDAITRGQISAAFNAIYGLNASTDSETKATVLSFAFAMLQGSAKGGITGFFKGISLFFKIFNNSNYNFFGTVTRAEAALYFKTLCE